MIRNIELLVFLTFNGCFALISKPSEVLFSKSFVHSAILDQDGSYLMLWTPLENKIDFEVQVRQLNFNRFKDIRI